MTSVLTALVTVVSLCVGALFGSVIRNRVPGHHLQDDSRDVIKLATGMIATLVALVIGLLVTSSKSTYDQANGGVTQIGAKVIILDRLLSRYGPETKAIRTRIKEGMATSIEQLWPADGLNPSFAAIERPTGMDEVHDMILQLAPQDEAHRILRSHAVTTCVELAHSRWLIVEQRKPRRRGRFSGC